MIPTSKLEAVNVLLSSIGEAPVASLQSGLVDAEVAETIINNVTRDLNSQGWSFNTDIAITLLPDSNGEIVLPANTLSVDLTKLRRDSEIDLVYRSGKLYNRMKHTFNIGKSVEVDLIVSLDFDELPEPARRFITIKSARIFQNRVLGSETLHGFQIRDEEEAWLKLQQSETEVEDHNIFDNYSTARVLDRSFTKVI
jgi:hypothetical protein